MGGLRHRSAPRSTASPRRKGYESRREHYRMTTIPLDAMVRRASRMAERMFDEEVAVDMFWLIDTPAGIISVLSPVFAENPTQCRQVKGEINEAMREFLREHDAMRFVRAAEAWVAELPVPWTDDEGFVPRTDEVFVTHVLGSSIQVLGRRNRDGRLFVDQVFKQDKPEGRSVEEVSKEFAENLPGIKIEIVTGPEAEDLISRLQAQREWIAKGSGTLADHPLRKEQIVLMASDGREVLMAWRDIVRPPAGRPHLGRLSEIERPKELRGAWVKCLPGTSRSSSGAS